MDRKTFATLFAVLAAVFYAINIPFSKILLEDVGPTMMSSFLYLGAGLSMGAVFLVQRRSLDRDDLLGRSDLLHTVGMIVLDIAAPILLMHGITMTSSGNVSLLNNLEIVATALIALALFGEKVGGRLWIAIILITASGMILSVDHGDGFSLDGGSLCVIGACLCWGLENNCTRAISGRSSSQIVMVKGLCSGTGCMTIAMLSGETLPASELAVAALLLGAVSYGLSINLYILAQRHIGAARTSAYYSLAPFIGVAFAFVILGERPDLRFFVSLALMVVGTAMVTIDTLGAEEHDHVHRHGEMVHSHPHGPLHHLFPIHHHDHR
ncbi:MAG: DMT family transporter [archaeon]|nr:DMT family transporter [archaeon]